MDFQEETGKKFDVVTLGEILIDFTSAGFGPEGQLLYERNPGGAPANVAVAVSRLGGRAAFIGTTGDDPFGAFLSETLERYGVETRGMSVSKEHHTTLAFVTLSSDGERSFSFCRNPGADTALSLDRVGFELVTGARILHVGSLSLTHEPARSATFGAVVAAKQAGVYISYDPNWRKSLWEGRTEEARGLMWELLSYADLVKVSEVELELLTGTGDRAAGAAKLLAQGALLVLVTLGADGVFYKTRTIEGTVRSFPVQAADTTGAGDAFVGGVLYRLTRRQGEANPFILSRAELESDLLFANAVASRCVTKRGAIPAMPCLSEVETVLGGKAVP
jgi:fructokinase